MADLLKYRFPGKKATVKSGFFKPVDEVSEGFVVATFNLDRVFVFEENPDEIATYHFSDKIPFVIDEPNYLHDAAVFLDELKAENLGKAVFSRIKGTHFAHQEANELFNRLEMIYPSAFVYLISSEFFGTWVGASPEILLKAESEKAYTMALAGTKKATDEAVWGTKELEEQQFVTDFIERELHALQATEIVLSGPREVVAGPVKHLRTEINFLLNKKTPFDYIKHLHPTPAVSGLPREKSLKLIGTTERHDRSLYAGVIGFISPQKTEVYVNLRCCQLVPDAAYLYLGGGFTKDSDLKAEWEETENKSKTLLNIIQQI